MTILAVEFSSERRSVALARDGVVLCEAVEQTGGRGTNAFGLIEKALAESKSRREEIDAIAIGLGPGSYTGIRAAIALAQGWQLACRDGRLKLLGVGSVEALAIQAQTEKLFGRVNMVIDAQRGEFYLSTWEISVRAGREISPLKIVAGAEVAFLKSSGAICIGPEQEPRMFPHAAAVARLAAGRTDFLPGEKLEPVYLRETTFVKAPPARDVTF